MPIYDFQCHLLICTFDRLSAHFQKIKNPKLITIGLIIAKSLDLELSPSNLAKYFLKILQTTKSTI